jgi:mono/diheme cytochrome c family protein
MSSLRCALIVPTIASSLAVFASASAGAADFAAASGVYSEAQAERGAQVYESHCIACHAAGMNGGPGAPPLTGRIFLVGWQAETVGTLYDYLKTTMPTGAAGTLSDQQYADALALILKTNGFPTSADGAELAPDPAALAAIAIGAPE